MFSGPFALALTAGMAATVNPCGFALLPAYLSAFVGLDDGDAGGNRALAIGKALKVAAVLTAGFVTVFGLFGAVITKLLDGVEEYLPWATIVIGIGLVGLGVYLLTGRQIVINIPKLNKGGADGTLFSMYLFGVSYAVASLSCTIGPFLAVTSTTFRNESYLSGVMVFVLYGLGMGVVVGVLTLAVALAKDGLVAKFRSLLPMMNKIAGVPLLVAGAYVAYYGWYEVRLFNGSGSADDPIIDVAIEIQSWLLQFVPSTDNAPWYGVAGAVIFAAAGLWAWRRRDPGSDPGDVEPSEPELADA
ncbi:MAG: cytochrome c biogenesis protein CcdA [Ilumatobacter sp.]|nr:cytochrome c biogenesis protein CcdA [Ilumatobacter sp.]